MKPKRSLYYKVLSVILTSTFLFSSLVFAPKAYAANNPALASSCGLNVMLVLDSSTSMAASDIATAKSAAIGLVNSLMPSTPTKIGVIDFNTNIQGASLSPTTDKAAVLAKINTYVNHPNGVSTNWQAALQAADGMTGAGDLVIIITDGNPNYPTDAATALTSAVTAANSLKSSGTRVLAIGINSSGTQGGLNQANLEAISGSQVKNFPGQAITNINQVDVALGDINALSGVLSDISSALCPATITVTANTPYTVVSGTSVPFAYNVSVSKGGSQCRLLDNAQAPVNGGSGAGAYSAANPINWIPPLPPGAYGYFVQCRTTVGSVVTVVSNAITVNVTPPPRPDLTASAPPQASATVGTPATFTSTVSNIGSLTTGASFPNFFQLSSAGNGAGTLTDLPAATMSALAAGAAGNASATYTFATAGQWSVRACANKSNRNAFGAVVESDTGNNCSAWTGVSVGLPPVPVVTVSATPITGIVNRISPTITWSVTNNPTSCTASGDWSGSKAVGGGSQSQGALGSVRNYTYILTCTNIGGASVPASATVVVNPVPPPASATLMSDPTPAMIVLGQTVLLTWTSTGATSCAGTGFNTGGATHNSVGVPVVPPVLPTTYTIVCSNSQGVPSAPSSVTVTTGKKKPIYTEPR